MTKFFGYISLLLCLSDKMIAQGSAWQPASKEEIVNAYTEVCKWYVNTSTYSFSVKYTSYTAHLSTEVIESSNGYYKRSGNKYITEAIGIKTIQNEKIRLVVDTSDKVIAITNPGTLSPNIQGSGDLIKLLENVKSLRKRRSDKNTIYRIDFKNNEIYEAYEFSLNEKGLLDKLVYFYAEQIEKDYGNGSDEKPSEKKIKPRLEIVFQNYKFPVTINDKEFSERSVVLASNSKIILLDKYKNYQLKDYRIKDKK